MTIANNAIQDGQPHLGNLAVPTTQTLTVNLPWVADFLKIRSDVSGCVLHLKDGVGADWQLTLDAGVWEPWYGRFKSFFVTKNGAGTARVEWYATQTRLDAGDYGTLTGEGISSHAAAVVSVA